MLVSSCTNVASGPDNILCTKLRNCASSISVTLACIFWPLVKFLMAGSLLVSHQFFKSGEIISGQSPCSHFHPRCCRDWCIMSCCVICCLTTFSLIASLVSGLAAQLRRLYSQPRVCGTTPWRMEVVWYVFVLTWLRPLILCLTA